MSEVDNWTPPERYQEIPPGWTTVNDAGPQPYLNYCRECGWASSIALWFKTGGPYCPRCKSDQIGTLVPDE